MNNFLATLSLTDKYLALISLFLCGAMVQSAGAVQPDAALYSDQAVARTTAYKEKAEQLTRLIAAAGDEQEKQQLLLQQQLLAKLEEFSNTPGKPALDLQFSKLDSRQTLSWQEVEQYLDRYIRIMQEGLLSSDNQKNTKEQMQTLYNQLIALADNSPEQNIVQLQHAIQVRKFNQQSEIIKQLKQGLESAKKRYPAMLERVRLNPQIIFEQDTILTQARESLRLLEDKEKQTTVGNDVLIQQQESVLSGFIGQELTDDEKKVMHYERLKLLELRVQQLLTDSRLLEGKTDLLDEEQKTAWFLLLGNNTDFSTLATSSSDSRRQIDQLKEKTGKLHSAVYSHEKTLSALRGGNALIGPKAQELLTILDQKVRTISTRLSSVVTRTDLLENKGQLLVRAIDLKQSSIGSMVTRSREATYKIFEKIIEILKYPLVSYSGMSLSLLLFIQLFTLLVCTIIVNRLYGHMVYRTGRKRNWSEQTVHLVQVVGKYPFIFIIAMITLSVVGINTRSLALVAGALSVGIGFGMQAIVNNLVSGIILLFDKSIRPGDFISLGENSLRGGFRGSVVQMNIRATVLRTNDNINIIIPNADLMASKVVNWTYSDDRIRFKIPFSVAYGTDIDRVKTLIKDAIMKLPTVLSEPEPQILLAEHADSSLAFVAAIWVEGQSARQPARTTDTVLAAIYRTLHEHGIEIPFPKLDVRLQGAGQPVNHFMPPLDAGRDTMFTGTMSQ